MTVKWLKWAAIRAIRTVAQCAASLIGVGAVMSDIDWMVVGSSALLAGILSLLTSIGSLPEVELEDRANKFETAAKENEDCYVQMLRENNNLRETLYSGKDVK